MIAEQIRSARQRAGLTQAQLARRLGVGQQVVSRWESPQYERFSLRTLRRIAKALRKQLVVELR